MIVSIMAFSMNRAKVIRVLIVLHLGRISFKRQRTDQPADQPTDRPTANGTNRPKAHRIATLSSSLRCDCRGKKAQSSRQNLMSVMLVAPLSRLISTQQVSSLEPTAQATPTITTTLAQQHSTKSDISRKSSTKLSHIFQC